MRTLLTLLILALAVALDLGAQHIAGQALHLSPVITCAVFTLGLLIGRRLPA